MVVQSRRHDRLRTRTRRLNYDIPKTTNLPVLLSRPDVTTPSIQQRTTSVTFAQNSRLTPALSIRRTPPRLPGGATLPLRDNLQLRQSPERILRPQLGKMSLSNRTTREMFADSNRFRR